MDLLSGTHCTGVTLPHSLTVRTCGAFFTPCDIEKKKPFNRPIRPSGKLDREKALISAKAQERVRPLSIRAFGLLAHSLARLECVSSSWGIFWE